MNLIAQRIAVWLISHRVAAVVVFVPLVRTRQDAASNKRGQNLTGFDTA